MHQVVLRWHVSLCYNQATLYSREKQALVNIRQYRIGKLIICVLIVGIAGCSASRRSIATPTPTGIAGSERRVTLTLWHAWPSPEQHTLARLIHRYNQSNPLTQVIPQAMPIASLTSELRAAARAGSGPHMIILQSHTIGALAEENILLPLDDLLTTSSPLDQLLPTAVNAATAYDQSGATHLYGLPLTFDTLALYYRKIDVDTPPADIDALLETAHDLTDAAAQPPVWGLAYTLSLDKTIGYLYAFDGSVFDTEGELVLGSEGRAGTERWLTWLTTLHQDDELLAVPASESIAVDSTLRAQTALMTIDWAHALPNYSVLWGDNLGVSPLPQLASTDQAPQPYVQSDVLALNAYVGDTSEQQAALDFMAYLLDADSQQALLEVGKQPTLLHLNLDGDTQALEAARAFRTQALQGRAIPNSPIINSIVLEELERMQFAVLRGLSSPADAVTHTDAVLREQLSQHTLPPGTQQ